MKTLFIFRIWHIWKHWLDNQRKTELERIQERLNQEQWQNSLANRAHESDLAAGYNLSHFNTMQ